MKLTYHISMYDKETEFLVLDLEIIDCPIGEIQKLYGEPSTEPMGYCYDITEKERSYFEKLIKFPLNFEAYDYQFGGSASD